MSDDQLNVEPGAREPVLLMPASSRYAGQPIDVSSRHSIEIRPPGGRHALIESTDRHVVVDHFYHEEQFWRAVIPLDGIDQIFGQAFNFSKAKTRPGENGPEVVFDKNGLPKRAIPILNHVQSRFTLKPGHSVELYRLGCQGDGDPVHRLSDFVYSLEAVGPSGIKFNVRDGLTGNLISTHRFLSTHEMVFERIVLENQYVTETPPIPLSEPEKRALITKSLLRSHQAGMTEAYYLYRVCGTNNCTSSPLQIVDHVVDYNLFRRIGSGLYRLPLSPRFYLRIRGLDSDPSVRKLVKSEFDGYVQDPRTQERKREYVRAAKRSRRAAQEAPDDPPA